MRLHPFLKVSLEETQDIKNIGNWPHAAEMHIKGMILVSSDSCIFPHIVCVCELLSHVQLFVTPWTAASQASISITNSRSLPKLMSIESMMPSNHLIFFHPLLLLPSIFPSIRVFSNESVFCIRWPKYLMSRNICLLQCHEDVSLSFLL